MSVEHENVGSGKKPLRALLIEDSELDAELLRLFLKQCGYEVVYRRVDSATLLIQALDAGVWDIALCDYELPGFSWPEALEIIKGRNLEIPFIIVSGKIGEDIAVDAMLSGVHDYVMKNKLARLRPAIERELREAEIRRTRQRIIEKNRYLAAIVNSSEDAIVGQRLDGIILAWNAGAERLYGYTESEIKGHTIFRIVPAICHDELRAIFQKVSHGEKIESYETVHEHKDGRIIDVSLTVSPIINASRKIICASTIARDITERKQIEAERNRMFEQLNKALAEVKTLRGLLPVCAGCKKIRDNIGDWQSLETYINEHSEAACTHSICPECLAQLYPEFKTKAG